LETVGAAGSGLTRIVAVAVALVQPPALTESRNVPEVCTVMLCVLIPVFQKLLLELLEVSLTLSPLQKVVGPFVLIIGAAGEGVMVTVIGVE
jgi:hypothetical protein